MKERLKRWLRPALFTLGGALAGLGYYYLVGCSTGACAIILPTLMKTPSQASSVSSPVLTSLRRTPLSLSPCRSSTTALFQRNSRFFACFSGSW